MSYKTIEFICTANNGRSTIASAIAQDYLVKNGLSEYYQATSSGSHAYTVLSGNMPLNLKKTVIINGVEEGVHENKELADTVKELADDELKVKYEQDVEFKKIFDEYAEQSRKYYAKQEESHSREVAEELGIEKYLDGNFKQTVASGNTIAVLAMGESNLKEANKIYMDSAYTPEIMEVISKYVKGEASTEVPNTFGKSKQEYKAMVEQLKYLVPLAVDKLIAEYESTQKNGRECRSDEVEQESEENTAEAGE
ncbi:MAG: hypothetical protein ACMXYG_06560 [Candidatus Woesearchaeota archaeon]